MGNVIKIANIQTARENDMLWDGADVTHKGEDAKIPALLSVKTRDLSGNIQEKKTASNLIALFPALEEP